MDGIILNKYESRERLYRQRLFCEYCEIFRWVLRSQEAE